MDKEEKFERLQYDNSRSIFIAFTGFGLASALGYSKSIGGMQFIFAFMVSFCFLIAAIYLFLFIRYYQKLHIRYK